METLRAGAENIAKDGPGPGPGSWLGEPLAASEQAEDGNRERHREAK